MAMVVGGPMVGQDVSELVIYKHTVVQCPAERAFRTFTEGIAGWWPLETHSVGEGRARTAVFEAGVGGRIYERWDDGTECDWGRVTVWEPPGRVAFSWKPNPAAEAPTQVDVRFTADGEATAVEIEHRGWERLAARASETHASYDSPGGWTLVLACYTEAAGTG